MEMTLDINFYGLSQDELEELNGGSTEVVAGVILTLAATGVGAIIGNAVAGPIGAKIGGDIGNKVVAPIIGTIVGAGVTAGVGSLIYGVANN